MAIDSIIAQTATVRRKIAAEVPRVPRNAGFAMMK
jgi:hypothetical protein